MSSASMLSIRIGDAELALPLTAVDEILRMAALEHVTGASPLVRGALNLRGEIVVVLDVSSLLAQPPVSGDPSDYIVVVRGLHGRYAILCNDTNSVAEVETRDRHPLPSQGDGPVSGIVLFDGRLVPVLDLEVLLERAG